MKELKIVEYKETLGNFSLPEGVFETLKGLPIEKQIEFFIARVNGFIDLPLDRCLDVDSVIVKDGIIIGVMMRNDINVLQPCYIGDCVCTWDSEDNNGAGYKSRTEYTRLVFKQ